MRTKVRFQFYRLFFNCFNSNNIQQSLDMNIKMYIVILAVLIGANSQTLSEVDFTMGSVYTKSYLWKNFIGISIEYQNIKSIWNTSLFQAYQLNAYLRGDWTNVWTVSLKTPLGHKWNCSLLATNISNPNVTCNFQTQGNTTYWQILGAYVWNAAPQPNWCIGYDMQGSNLSLYNPQKHLYDWGFQVYRSTRNYLYCCQLVDYGDKMVERNYKTSYTPADFVKDIQKANYVQRSVGFSGPGITDEASKDWLLALEDFKKVSFNGHYTVRCVVFPDPTKITIEAILSDNATKYYLRERFRVNETYAYSDFAKLPLGINDIKLTTGNGVDGMTNTFAATIWALDIIFEFIQMNGWQIDFNHIVDPNNFQGLLGPAPDFKPQPIYYALIFATIIRNNAPEVILPSFRSIISSKIKAYGFSDGITFKILLINKDTNVSLNGKVLVKSPLTSTLKCIYIQAPSLTDKDNITIGGYKFIGGNATVQGEFVQKKVTYNYAVQGYEIPIKYAQAVMCETADEKYKWPKGGKKLFGNKIVSSLSLLILLIVIVTF